MQRLLYGLSESDPNSRPSTSLSITDRLNSVITVALLMLLATFILTMMYFWGFPIACHVPKHFTKSHRKFTNQVSVWIMMSRVNDTRDYVCHNAYHARLSAVSVSIVWVIWDVDYIRNMMFA